MNREYTAAKSWAKKWGFLTSEYHEMFQKGKELRGSQKESTACTLPPIEDGVPLVQQPIIPKTSGQVIGARVGTEHLLNPFGNAASEAAPRHNLAHNLGWPKEALL